MRETRDLYEVPEDLTAPTDDGACDHLPGLRLTSVTLPATSGEWVAPSKLPGRTIIYCYSRTRRPGEEMPREWDDIPGARGCTPQSCAFRDRHAELQTLDARVFGLSTQSTEYQREAAGRLLLPFKLLSYEKLAFAKALDLQPSRSRG